MAAGGPPGARARLVADDHEGLGFHALGLEPIAGAPAAIGLVEALGEDALKVLLAGDAEQVGAVADVLCAHQDRRARRDQPAEREPALLQRLGPEDLAIEEEEVEGVEHRAL